MIARRELSRGSDIVQLILLMPESRDDDMACTWRIDGLDKPVEFTSYGIDAIQAIQIALKMAAATLESMSTAELPIRFLDFDDHGIFRLMP